MSHDLPRLIASIDLEALADQLLGGHRGHGRGARWPSPVPDHPQTGKTPPMSIFVDRHGTQRWTCWATGRSGTAIDLVATALRLDVGAAIEWLDTRHGRLGADHVVPRRPPAPIPSAGPSAALLEYVETCHRYLRKPSAAAARLWLIEQRHITGVVLDANRVGFDPGSRVLRRPRGLPYRGPGIVLPVFDATGDVVYAQVRYLDPDRTGRKYDNPSAIHGTKPPLSWTQPWSQPSPESQTVVCEGTLDAMTVAGTGARAVAVIAAGDAGRSVDALATIPGWLVIAMDHDDAGQTARQALTEGLVAAGRCELTQLRVPGDINEPAQRSGPRFQAVLQSVLRSLGRGRQPEFGCGHLTP